LSGVQEVKDVLILVCGHNSRDARCGTIAPYLRAEFEKCLERKDWDVLEGPVEVTQDDQVAALLGPKTEYAKTARIGSISHIGGHKFAGNVIIYIPPGMMAESGEPHALAGCGIWYGRVQPNHAEGIIQETVLKGFVIEELFRGGIRQGGELLRI
jgi:(2Fe-2S) ferredoxin